MKRILCLILSLSMVFSLVGCSGKDSKDTSKNDNNKKTNIETRVDKEEEIVIRDLKDFPDDVLDITDEEMVYYLGIIVPALIDLDIEALKPYITEKNIEDLTKILENEEYKALWEKTIGNFIYLPSACTLVAKSVDYMFGKYITENWIANNELPEEISELSNEELDSLYNQYYPDATYQKQNISYPDLEFEDCDDGGKLFDIDEIFNCLGLDEISRMTPYSYKSYFHYIFGDNYDDTSLGYDYISESINGYETFLSYDLDKVIEKIDSENEMEEDDFYYKTFEAYYKNKTTKEKIEKWMNENVFLYRNMNSITVFIKESPKGDYTYDKFTEEEFNMIKDLPIYEKSYMFYWNDKYEKTDIGVYYDIVDHMINAGEIEKISY